MLDASLFSSGFTAIGGAIVSGRQRLFAAVFLISRDQRKVFAFSLGVLRLVSEPVGIIGYRLHWIHAGSCHHEQHEPNKIYANYSFFVLLVGLWVSNGLGFFIGN